MNREIKGVIFDLDGTLACTADDLLAGINHMLQTIFGFPPLSMEEMMTGVNFCERDYVRHLVNLSIEKAGRNDIVITETLIDECVASYTNYYGDHYLDNTYIYEGLSDVVRQMKNAGIRLAVDTNKKADHALEIVEKIIPDLFEIVIGDGMVPHKPDPSGALLIAKKIGLEPDEILFVGDSDVDMRTAKNAGMIAVAVSWGYRDEATLRQNGADHYVTSAEELLALCRE